MAKPKRRGGTNPAALKRSRRRKAERELTREEVGPMVYGNGITHIARMVWEQGNYEAAVECMPRKMTARTFVDIMVGKADIEGNDVEGFRVVYREGKEATP